MNCLDVHRRLTTDPKDADPVLTRHVAECATCGAFAGRVAAFEAKLHEVIKVPVPEGLASRVILRQSLGERRTWRGSARWLAMAASVFVAAGAAGVLWFARPAPLDEVVLAHIDHEPAAVRERRNVQLAQLNDVLRSFHAKATGDIGQIHYVSACPMRKKWGAHVVLQGQKGPVTVFFMPGEFVKDRRLIHGNRHGVIVPTTNGSMAIIGSEDESYEALEQRLRAAIRFSI